MFETLRNILKGSGWRRDDQENDRGERHDDVPNLRPLGFADFLNVQVPPRDYLLGPIIPERSLSMLYAPRGVGKSWLALSIALAIASGAPLLRWNATKRRRVLYVDGEMPLAALQERIASIAAGLGTEVSNDDFRILAADATDGGIDIGTPAGQRALDSCLVGIDFVVLDNISTLCSRPESASDAWTPLQAWLLSLRRRGISVLLVHHAGTNGRQRGTSRREDVLDTVIALRRPHDYSPDQGARFEVHYEKLRNRVEGDGALPFEAVIVPDGDSVQWLDRDLAPPPVERAAQLFREGMSVRAVAKMMNVSSSAAGRLRQDAVAASLLVDADAGTEDSTEDLAAVA